MHQAKFTNERYRVGGEAAGSPRAGGVEGVRAGFCSGPQRCHVRRDWRERTGRTLGSPVGHCLILSKGLRHQEWNGLVWRFLLWHHGAVVGAQPRAAAEQFEVCILSGAGLSSSML